MPHLTLADFEHEALDTLTTYCTIPCLSPIFDAQWAENGHIDAGVELLAAWARRRRLGAFEVEIMRIDGRTPMLCVTVESTASTSGTCVLYGHLDKQPPLGDWSDGLDPFEPVRRENRLYARGVADDGYATFSALLALEAMEANAIAHGRCVVLIEASEESGSTDLEAYLDALVDRLGAVELMICLDSGGLTYDRLWLTTSLRGLVNAELTVSVLDRAQHSGSASGVVPSSFRILRQLLDRVENSTNGEVLLEEFRAVIPAGHVLAAREIADEFGDVIARDLQVVDGVELMGSSPAERILRRNWYPALSIIGMGGVPEPSIAGNVMRTSTTCVLSLRLPPSVDAGLAAEALSRTLCTDVPSNAKVTVAFKTPPSSGWVAPPLAAWLESALLEASLDAFNCPPGFFGEGGSIPFLGSLARRYPAVQFVATGVLGPDSNAHGIDEMLDLDAAVGVTNAVMTILGAYAASTRDRP